MQNDRFLFEMKFSKVCWWWWWRLHPRRRRWRWLFPMQEHILLTWRKVPMSFPPCRFPDRWLWMVKVQLKEVEYSIHWLVAEYGKMAYLGWESLPRNEGADKQSLMTMRMKTTMTTMMIMIMMVRRMRKTGERENEDDYDDEGSSKVHLCKEAKRDAIAIKIPAIISNLSRKQSIKIFRVLFILFFWKFCFLEARKWKL